MAQATWTERNLLVAGNLRICIGRATLASGGNFLDTGLNRIITAPAPQAISDTVGTGNTTIVKINTAEGTQGDNMGKLTIESADALEYHIIAYGK